MVCGGCGFAGLWRFPEEEAAHQLHCTEPCQYVIDQPWAWYGALTGQTQSLQCAVSLVEPALGAVVGGLLGRWFVAAAVLPVCGFPEEEAALGNHSAQSSASVR